MIPKFLENIFLHFFSSLAAIDYEYDYDINDSVLAFDWLELGPSLCVYGVTFFGGILGNILILVAVIRNTQFVKSSPVNVFLGSLATADLLLILICLPLKVSTM